ncbi:FliO/MopB family protein [Alterisphingorhabdus coralli]|uniref:Flagellar biosynthetic protein FliO n=1 Tax=Alterisphingorhabdus coralli TaxID=3071408 RepID=A0AA97F6C7_9SPHN|nr:flagellar biosynthetic protein FliO [Parasphingorhabdus sp. SCSIO 66989]WOE74773.1 flagellar biosynthetic protein FliO [Parasphingorhabdus sp. SCSIO 66989]
MTYYILKLVIMLPIMAVMIYAALWTYRKYQPGLSSHVQKRELKLVETMPMGTSGKLAVVEFAGQKILLSATRGNIQHIASADLDVVAVEKDVTEAELQAAQVPFQNLMQRALSGARKQDS